MGKNHKLKRLYRDRDAKFDEIVCRLGRELHPSTTSLTKMERQRLAEDAEELTDNWATAEAEGKLPRASTELQRLLGEHQEICKRIIAILDSE